jgi:exonuclease III
MKILSFNCQGVASPSKKSALKRLIECNLPDIILLQKTLGEEENVVKLLESMFKLWNFLGYDANGRSGGLAVSWNIHKVKVLNSWAFVSGWVWMFMQWPCGCQMTVINLYGPYLDQIPSWDSFFRKTFMKSKLLILGGSVNFSLGVVEVWGPKAHPDPQSDYFYSDVGS